MSGANETNDGKPSERINLAGRLAKRFLHTKVTPLIMLAIILFGFLAIVATPRLYNPEIVVPAAQIIVARPGNSPEQIQNQVVRPLEQLMSSLTAVKHTYGYATDGMGVVTVQFQVGADETRSLLYLYNELQRNLDRLPPGTQMPLVKSIGINDVPIMAITLSSNQLTPDRLRAVGERFLTQIHTVPNVGVSQVIGWAPEAVHIDVLPQKLASAGIGLGQLLQLLKGSNVVLPGGQIVAHNHVTPLRVRAAFASVRGLGDLVIGVHHGQPILLKDVAQIRTGPKKLNEAEWFGYGSAAKMKRVGDTVPAVTITVGKRPGTNAVSVARAVQKKLATLERDALPAGVKVHITRNYGARANSAVNTLLEHLSIAVAVVLVILLFFLGWREAAIVTSLVPLTLFVVLGIGMVIGQTINRITLFALILSLGLLVDAGIVVIENIHRHMYLRRDIPAHFSSLVVSATNEIGSPTNVATLAVILAFLPMLFVTGMMGPFMRPIPINVPVAMIASLLLAYIVVPYIAVRWLHRKAAMHEAIEREGLEQQPEADDRLQRWYKAVFLPLLDSRRRRNLFFGVVGLLLIASLLMPLWQFIRPGGMNGPQSLFGVSLKMLPEGNVNTFTLEIQSPAGTALDETQRVAQAVGNVVGRSRYVRDYVTYLGRTGPLSFAGMVRGDQMLRGDNVAQLIVNLVPKGQRPHTASVASKIWKALTPTRRRFASDHILLLLTPPGPPTRAQVVARIFGPDYQKDRQIGRYVQSQFKTVYGMTGTHTSITATHPQYLIKVNAQKAMMSGVAPAQVALLVRHYVAGTTIGSVFRSTIEPEDIVVRLRSEDRSSIQQIKDLTIQNRMKQSVPLGGLVTIKRVSASKPILSQDGHPVVYVMGNTLGFSPENAALVLNQRLDGKRLPDGIRIGTANLGFTDSQPSDVSHYQILWGGNMRLTLDVFRDLGAAFIVALVFIYLLLVGYYQSFILPMIVMGAIPLTLIGIFPGHWLFGMPFNATSMIGFIALAGIVVRNSLLLIDFILEYRRSGYGLRESVIEAGAVRFRPILLTALAIIFGSSVMVSDPVFGGLAIALISGTFASTALTLIVIPLVYYLWQRREKGEPGAEVLAQTD